MPEQVHISAGYRVKVNSSARVRDSDNLADDFLIEIFFCPSRRLSLGGSPSSSRLDVGTSYRLVKKRKYRQQL